MKRDKIGILIFILIFAWVLAAASAIRAQSSNKQESAEQQQQLSGGAFTLVKTVLAGGGTTAQNQSLGVQTTAGQPVAGNISTGGQFSLNSGFWTPDAFVPTAATVTVSGRVTTAQGIGIRNARVSILLPSGETRSTLSSAFGYFRFGDVEVGETYIFTISSKRFVFSQTTQALTVSEERDDINFVAVEN